MNERRYLNEPKNGTVWSEHTVAYGITDGLDVYYFRFLVD